MEKFISPGSNDSPIINFDPEAGILFLGGSSLPENVFDVYKPIAEWLDEYTASPIPKTNIVFSFDYLNTASSHMIMQIMEKIMQLKEVCEELKITWHYEKTDIDMREFGEEISELIDFPIEFMAKEG